MAYVTTAPVKGADAIGKAFAEAYGKVGKFMAAKGVKSAGQPLSITKAVNGDGSIVFDAGIPLASKPAPAAAPAAEGDAAPADKPEGGEGDEAAAPPEVPAEVKVGDTPAGKALKVVYKGPYKGIEGAMRGIHAYTAARGIGRGEAQWAQYISDPGDTKEADLITHLYQAIK